MTTVTPDQFIWNEKYRPKLISECILPNNIKSVAEGWVKEGRCPTLLFTGGAGIGKTTLANCVANELGADMYQINASMETGVDNIRTKILQFASTVSFSDAKKITLLDEADFLSANAQASLRNFIEQFAGNHSMILTCNFKNKLIEPLHSRCQIIDFKITNSERPKVAAQFFKRVTQILDLEGVEYDKKVVAELINVFFPDFRRCLNELQKYAAGGKIDSGVLIEFSDDSFNDLINSVKNKKWNDMRKWVANHNDMEPNTLFKMFYDKSGEKMEAKSMPALVLLLAEYQFKSANVVNQEINTVAFLTELMTSASVVWK